MKATIREKFIAGNTYIKKEKDIKSITQPLEKEEHTKLKHIGGRKQYRLEQKINKIEKRKTTAKINENKS